MIKTAQNDVPEIHAEIQGQKFKWKIAVAYGRLRRYNREALLERTKVGVQMQSLKHRVRKVLCRVRAAG